MQNGVIALWMYRNEGGDAIQKELKTKLENRGHIVINNFDMRECYFLNGDILTKCGYNLLDADLLYHMNADEQNTHQNEILRALDQAGVTILNDWDAFSKAKDKFTANLLLRKNGISVPPSALLPTSVNSSIADRIFSEWGSVLFKPRSNHGGKGIIKFNDLSTFIDFTQTMDEYINNYYLEKYINFDRHDYRVEIFDDKVVGGYCRTKTHDFKTNIACGGLMTPLSPPEEFNQIALEAAKILNIKATIVDMVKSQEDGKIYVLEVNPIMGIFVESGNRSGEKSTITTIDPVYANDNLKLDRLANYLDLIIKEKQQIMNKTIQKELS